ncbi:hypothetical protein FJZ21_02060 [Candidatus Pacearchaeota archaeon]|nr:hypothetical protein [Candidatus Pacearchaeota archaeon]
MNKKAIANIRILNLIGSLFFIWGIAAVIDNIFKINTGIAPLLWMSYISLILLGIGILRKNASLVASQIAIIFIPYIFWNLDFFHHLITGNSLFGITDYFFIEGPLSGKIITLQHIFNLPLSLYSLHLIGLKSIRFPIVSIIQISLVFIVSRLSTDYEKNVNCVYHNCANFSFGLPYIAEWFIAQFIMILITSWFLIKIFRKKEK